MSRLLVLFVGLFAPGLALACYTDLDHDGYGVGSDLGASACANPDTSATLTGDCDDEASYAHPGGTERCNYIDDDCDSQVDESTKLTFYLDGDFDGYGSAASSVQDCSAPTGYVTNSTDCNDADDQIHPNAPEICGNAIDDDCNAGTLDGGSATVYHRDADDDGYGDPAVTRNFCGASRRGWVVDATDCDDSLDLVNPGMTDYCNDFDDNCDGNVDEDAMIYPDADGDGYGVDAGAVQGCSAPSGFSTTNGDCDDADPLVTFSEEICNYADDDCDGQTDEGVATTYYADYDGDGYGDAGDTFVGCAAPSSFVSNATDCDGSEVDVHPNAAEICGNVRDDDCDGAIDEGTTTTFHADVDRDGYGDPAVTASLCGPGAGWVLDIHDCDDFDESIHPGALDSCNTVDDDCDGIVDENGRVYVDSDHDGFGVTAGSIAGCNAGVGQSTVDGDCDDSDAAVNPDATEACNLADDNCDGQIDEGAGGVTYYADLDADGFGDPGNTADLCNVIPTGWVSDNTDCNDSDPDVHPGATEICDDVDQDCDAVADDGLLTVEWHPDADADGYGDDDPTTSVLDCGQPTGYLVDASDCDDADALISPDATETCDGTDEDCDGAVDDGVLQMDWFADADGDGFGDPAVAVTDCAAPTGFVTTDTDCDDDDDQIHPGATEVCDDVDQDCDGTADDGLPTSNWFADGDADGFGTGLPIADCAAPSGTASGAGDCDDGDPNVYPGAAEHCDGADEDCDGMADNDAVDALPWFVDADHDGFGSTTAASDACAQVFGTSAVDTDCDDAVATTFPGAPEQCNTVDDDCNNAVDDNVVVSKWYADSDGDGFGDVSVYQDNCLQPAGYVLDGTDCDDLLAAVHPLAPELCNGIDDDCDLSTDEGAPGTTTWYADSDGDGFGDPLSTLPACTQPVGYVADATDCDDGDRTVTDGIDSYADVDGDGHGAGTSTRACTVPSGRVLGDDDCDDGDVDVFPGAPEHCDTVDEDCDGTADNDPVDGSTFYADVDNDGFGDAGTSAIACARPSGMAANDLDCDDGDALIRPGAPEQCDGFDNDCNGLTDDDVDYVDWYVDADSDGFGDENGTPANACLAPVGTIDNALDCDDGVAAINPNALEQCGGVDDDCDGEIDEDAIDGTIWYVDADGDGYGDDVGSVVACGAPTGSVSVGGDCADDDASVNPGAVEDCTDSVDNNCNGVVDADAVAVTWYADADGDGFGDPDVSTDACAQPTDYVADDTDCDDGDASVNPDAVEADPHDGVDQDCDGTAETIGSDADGDGYVDEADGGDDCDDTDPGIHPDAQDVPGDQIDQDCDGEDAFPDGDDRPWAGDGDDTGENPGTGAKGCDCNSQGGGGFAVTGLIVLLAARRRRG
jgi:hypothetical protein